MDQLNFNIQILFNLSSGTPNDKFQKVQYDGFVRKEPVADWDACYKIIVKVIESKSVIKSRDLNRQITVFSYFTERAAEAGLVGMCIFVIMLCVIIPVGLSYQYFLHNFRCFGRRKIDPSALFRCR